MVALYWLLRKWHLYRGVKFHNPVKRFHFERFEHYGQLLRGESPRISKDRLYSK